MRFLIHGSIAYDLLLGFEGNFEDVIAKGKGKLSVSFFSPHFERHHGGTAANVAWNLALLKQEAELVGVVGHDGGEYLDLLKKRGVGTSCVTTLNDHATAMAVIGTDSAERQIAFFHPGADAHAELPDANGMRADFGLIGARNPLLMVEGAAQLKKLNIPFLFDPGQQSHVLGRDDFRRAVAQSSGLIVNEYEWSLASEALGWEEADVVEQSGLLIITLGEKGVRLKNRTGEVHVPACKPAKVVNPTGAGDALRAGVLVGLASGWDLTQTGRLGAAIASFVVEQEGALLQSLDLSELSRRAKQAYGEAVSY